MKNAASLPMSKGRGFPRAFGDGFNLKTLWDHREQEITSAVTSVNVTKLPALFKQVGWEQGTKNFDIGAGKYGGNVTSFLADRGIVNISFDPFNLPFDHNRQAVECVRGGQADTATCTNDLNVLQGLQVRRLLLCRVHYALKRGGIAYFQFHEGGQI